MGRSYQNERRVLEGELCSILAIGLQLEIHGYLTVTKERCFIDTPPKDALNDRAMVPNSPCDDANSRQVLCEDEFTQITQAMNHTWVSNATQKMS